MDKENILIEQIRKIGWSVYLQLRTTKTVKNEDFEELLRKLTKYKDLTKNNESFSKYSLAVLLDIFMALTTEIYNYLDPDCENIIGIYCMKLDELISQIFGMDI